MNTLLNLLAVAGGAAAAWHLVRAAFRFLQGEVSGVWLDEMADTHARQGDLTSLEERRRERHETGRRRREAGLEGVAWLLLLMAPGWTAWPRGLYAAYAVFWVGPILRRARRGT